MTQHPEPAPTAGTPGAATKPTHRLDRRRFLGMVGIGVGTLAAAGAAGLTWKAVDGGVFATGTGPAYVAWDALAAPSAEDLTLVKAAVLAANAHNTQPWIFRMAPDRIDLFADLTRTIGAMDPLNRELDISLGCALENLVLAGPPKGRSATVTMLPDPGDPTHIARIDLVSTTAASASADPDSPLYAAIATRHTNRGAYDIRRPVTATQRGALADLVDVPGAEVVWFSSAAAKASFTDLTLRATEAIIADREQSADDYAWYRSDWDEIQAKKDGITIDPSGQTPLIRAFSKVVPVSRQQNNEGWLKGMRDQQLPTAAAFGAIVVPDPLDRLARLAVGRSWQRMHLASTVDGLAMQPLCQIPERIDREQSASLSPEFTTAMAKLLPSGMHPIMTFRVGYPTIEALRSPRRPARDVVVGG